MTDSQHHVHSLCALGLHLRSLTFNIGSKFPHLFFLIVRRRATMASPGMDNRIALMGVIIVRYQNDVRCVHVVSMGEESQSTAALLPVKDSVQVWVDRHVELGVASVEGETSTPHGVGHFGSDQIPTFLRPPVPYGGGEGDHAEVGHDADALIVLRYVGNVRTQHGIIILGPVEHEDQFRVVVVRKVHVRIDLHAKVLQLDPMKVQHVGIVAVDVVPVHHGAELGPRVGGALGILGVDVDGPDVVLVLLAVGVVVHAVPVPATGIVDEVGPHLGLLDDADEDAVGILGPAEGIVQSSGTQLIAERGDEHVDGSRQGSPLAGGVGRVAVVRTSAGLWVAFRRFDVDVSEVVSPLRSVLRFVPG
mmetsp:Transcript_25421/g.73533  ORF Transcript_25421/g.73533 Transcript_25421/m.73533 type:complete len:362 (-) Transcript_25421:171-1256(-)